MTCPGKFYAAAAEKYVPEPTTDDEHCQINTKEGAF
jgi:hypothetical protein